MKRKKNTQSTNVLRVIFSHLYQMVAASIARHRGGTDNEKSGRNEKKMDDDDDDADDDGVSMTTATADYELYEFNDDKNCEKKTHKDSTFASVISTIVSTKKKSNASQQ